MDENGTRMRLEEKAAIANKMAFSTMHVAASLFQTHTKQTNQNDKSSRKEPILLTCNIFPWLPMLFDDIGGVLFMYIPVR